MSISVCINSANAFAQQPELRAGQSGLSGFQFENSELIGNKKTGDDSIAHIPLRDGPAVNTPSVYIRHIEIRGAEAIPLSDLTLSVRSFEGKRLSGADFQRLANVLSRIYRERGFVLSRAVIEPQEFENETLVVQMSEGFLSKVAVNGDSSHHLVKHFKKAMDEQPLREKTLTRAISLARGATGYRIVDQTIEKDPDRQDGYIISLAVEFTPAHARLSVTNKGVRRGEPWRALLSARFNSVLRPGDQASLDFLTKPAAISELQYLRGAYATPLGSAGLNLFLGAALSETSPQSALADRDLDGSMRSGSIGIAYPIIKREHQQLTSLVKFDAVNASEEEAGVRLYNDRLRVLRISNTYQAADTNWRVGGVAQLSQGFDVFNSSDRSGELTSRPDADAQFLKLDGEINIRTQLSERIGLSAGAIGQYATSPLLYNEEFSYGGGQYGRGYDFGEILGDVGAAAFMEAGLHGGPLGVLSRWEIYSFVDVGAVWNKGAGLSADGKPLYSAGGGVRLKINDELSVGYEAAHPLTDAPYTEDDKSTRHRLQLTVSYN